VLIAVKTSIHCCGTTVEYNLDAADKAHDKAATVEVSGMKFIANDGKWITHGE